MMLGVYPIIILPIIPTLNFQEPKYEK
jgi:hypothetical protein